MHGDGIDNDVHMTSDNSDEETAAQKTKKTKFVIICGDNTNPGALVYPFAESPILNVGILEWNEDDISKYYNYILRMSLKWTLFLPISGPTCISIADTVHQVCVCPPGCCKQFQDLRLIANF